MKFLFFFLVVALAGSSIAQPAKPEARDLNADLQEFVELLPLDDILAIVFKYLNDPEVQQVINFIFGEEFKALVVEVESIKEYNAVIDYLDSTGLPVKKWIQALHELLDIPMSFAASTPKVGGLKAMINEIRDIVDWKELEKFYNNKLQTSPDFKNLVDKITGDEFRGFTQALAANKRIQEISAQLTAAGLDIAGFIKLLKDFFGLNY